MNQKTEVVYWEVYKEGSRFAYGPKDTMPDMEQRKSMKSAGYKLLVEGKAYRDAK